MPCTTDGARDYCHRIGSHEEGHGEVCAQSGILHAYFDGEGALLGNGEVAEATYGIAEDITDGVVTEDHSEGEHEEKESVLYERVVNGSDDSTDDAGKGYNRDSGHATLNLTEYFLFTQPHIQEEADGDRYDSDYQNLFEHTDSIHIDTFAGQPQYQQRCEYGGKESGSTGHTDRVSNVALTEERHDVARYASRTTAHEDDADSHSCAVGSKGWHLTEQPSEGEGYERHDGELCHRTDENVERTFCKQTEIVGRKCKSHRKHDDAEDDGLCVSFYPFKQLRIKESDHCSENDEYTRLPAQCVTDKLKKIIHY